MSPNSRRVCMSHTATRFSITLLAFFTNWMYTASSTIVAWTRHISSRNKSRRWCAASAYALLSARLPFHFADPLDPRIIEYERRTAGMVGSPEVLRKFSADDYGGIEVEDRLKDIHHPVLVLAGRHDRTCSLEASEFMAANIPDAKLVVFESSAHMTFVEENQRYVREVRDFLARHIGRHAES